MNEYQFMASSKSIFASVNTAAASPKTARVKRRNPHRKITKSASAFEVDDVCESVPVARFRGIRVGRIQNNGLVSASSKGDDRERARSGADYLAFTVKNLSGYWRYVHVTSYGLNTSSQPILFPTSYEAEMVEIWKRAIIDNALPWDEGVDLSTFRIVRWSTTIADETSRVLGDDFDDVTMRALMSRLTDAEAKMLGKEHDKARQSIQSNPEMDATDRSNMKDLSEEYVEFNLDTLME